METPSSGPRIWIAAVIGGLILAAVHDALPIAARTVELTP